MTYMCKRPGKNFEKCTFKKFQHYFNQIFLYTDHGSHRRCGGCASSIRGSSTSCASTTWADAAYIHSGFKTTSADFNRPRQPGKVARPLSRGRTSLEGGFQPGGGGGWKRSTIPNWGWNSVVAMSVMFRSRARWAQTEDINGGPLSEVMMWGRPNRETQWGRCGGRKWYNQYNEYSMWVWPREEERGPVMSSWKWANQHDGMGMRTGERCECVCGLWLFDRKHTHLVYWLMSRAIGSQRNPRGNESSCSANVRGGGGGQGNGHGEKKSVCGRIADKRRKVVVETSPMRVIVGERGIEA